MGSGTKAPLVRSWGTPFFYGRNISCPGAVAFYLLPTIGLDTQLDRDEIVQEGYLAEIKGRDAQRTAVSCGSYAPKHKSHDPVHRVVVIIIIYFWRVLFGLQAP